MAAGGGGEGSGVYPSMYWAGGRGVLSQHALGREGVYPSMHWAGVSAERGVCPGSLSGQGVSAWGVSGPVHAGIPHAVNRITDTCENITFLQLRCRR